MTYSNLDRHVERFMEVADALAEIGTIFESSIAKIKPESGTEALESVVQSVNELRIPGFFTYHLAQEGLSLVKLIAASVALAGKDAVRSEKINTVSTTINEAEPRLRQTTYDMEPYKSANAEEAIRTVAAGMAEQKNK